MALKVHPLGRTRELEGTGGSTIPFLGYVKVNLHILLLVILTMTYSKKIPVMVRLKIIYRAMGMMTKGKLTRATMTWMQLHFRAVMYGSLQLSCTGSRGNGERGRRPFPPQALTLQHPGNFVWMISRDMSVPHRGSPLPHLGPLAYMAAQASMQVHVLAEPALGPQLPTSVVLTATLWRVTAGFLLECHFD